MVNLYGFKMGFHFQDIAHFYVSVFQIPLLFICCSSTSYNYFSLPGHRARFCIVYFTFPYYSSALPLLLKNTFLLYDIAHFYVSFYFLIPYHLSILSLYLELLHLTRSLHVFMYIYFFISPYCLSALLLLHTITFLFQDIARFYLLFIFRSHNIYLFFLYSL